MSSRVLTVSGLYVSPSSRKPVPAVRVQGKWIEELGFHIGDQILVCESAGEIILKSIKNAGDYEDKGNSHI